MEQFIHPDQMTEKQRHLNMAAVHERVARATARIGGESDRRIGAAARDAAKRRRAAAARA